MTFNECSEQLEDALEHQLISAYMTDSDVKNCAPFVLGICPKTLDPACLLNLISFYLGFGGTLRRYTHKEARKAGLDRKLIRGLFAAEALANPVGAAELGLPFRVFPTEAKMQDLCFPAFASH